MHIAGTFWHGANRLWRGVRTSKALTAILVAGFVLSVALLYLNADTRGLTYSGRMWVLPLLPFLIPPILIWYLWEKGGPL